MNEWMSNLNKKSQVFVWIYLREILVDYGKTANRIYHVDFKEIENDIKHEPNKFNENSSKWCSF